VLRPDLQISKNKKLFADRARDNHARTGPTPSPLKLRTVRKSIPAQDLDWPFGLWAMWVIKSTFTGGRALSHIDGAPPAKEQTQNR